MRFRLPFLRAVFMQQYRELLAATGLLTTLTLPGSRLLFRAEATSEAPEIGCAYFPVVGLLLNVPLLGLAWSCAHFIPPIVLAALLVVALMVLTGGLHLDGLMDSCDGLFGGFTRERKLEIMRDSRMGSFGVLGGISVLLLKFACLAGLQVSSLPVVLLVTLPSARWCMVMVVKSFPGARAAGMGATFRRAVTPRALVFACVLSLIIVLAAGQRIGLLVWGVMTLTSLALGAWMAKKLGGLTGDTYGAIAEIAEVVGLFTFMLLRF